ncbi:glycosyltransferase [Georgenia thermotolerans]|uniref:Glycosyltransferase n=1 Tax=Georgenia thermotolerans TaxID=527326 RepID=A0A7J5UR31_9MICO|nr:glycosyltransferase [Georgenia thermotolerans]KAE8764886.1 glycosyltransferase [Georgenia thermotolerans]
MSDVTVPPAPEGLPYVSVVVPVHNDTARLRLCLQALAAQDYPADRFEVWVVDNNSDDDPRPALPEDERFQLLRERRRGSYAARNRALPHARGEVFAFTDSDCLPHPDWLSSGVRALLREPRPDAVGGAIRIFFDHGTVPTSGPEHFEAINEFRQRKYVEEWSFAATANLFVDAPVLSRLGGFDATLQSGGDLDFGTRLGRAGGRLIYDDDTVVDHPARSTWRELGRKTVRVANGIADRSAHLGRRDALARAVNEGSGAVTIWLKVWRRNEPAPRRAVEKVRYAAAFAYVRLLRTGVHLGRFTRGR